MNIRAFAHQDRELVIDLWRRCGLVVPWNDPAADIDGAVLVASAMGGYDGHRGSIFYLAVDPDYQGRGYARKIVDHLTALLKQRGCPKLNIMVRSSNQGVIEFYRRLGFQVDEILCVGKRLLDEGP